MVKNVTGGNKQKKEGRKNGTDRISSRPTRLVKEDGELYAQVLKTLGDGQLHVLCSDGRLRLCHIRGKFRGRGRRDNFATVGTFILVGLRGFESKRELTDKKLENCDLMLVYADSEKEDIHKREKSIDWNIFSVNDETLKNADEVVVEFSENNVEDDYDTIMKTGKEEIIKKDGPTLMINIDDI
jgi:initiation factor 1A